MAGIGLALRKLSGEDNIIGRAASIGHAAVVAAGPWIFTILSLGFITLLAEPVAGLERLATVRAAVIYAFAISLVASAPILIVTTRLVADALYQRRFERISGIYLAAMPLVLLPTSVLVGLLYSVLLSVALPLAIASAACCLIVALIWVSLALCGTVHDYAGVTIAFILGLLISVVCAVSAAVYDYSAAGIVWGFNCGLSVTLFWLMARVLTTFPHRVVEPVSSLNELLRAVRRYWLIALGALASSLAIWADKILMWLSPIGEKVDGGFLHAPLYDSAMFVALLVIIPSLSLFVIHLETDFFQAYQRYFNSIREHATLKRIEELRQELFEVTVGSLFHILMIQAALCFALVMLAPVIVGALNLQFRQISILRYGTLGALFQYVFLACSAVIVFLDRRGLYLLLQSIFLVLTAVLTWVSIELGWRYHGLGAFFAALISGLLAYFVMERSLRNLNYLTFVGNNPSVVEAK